MRSLFLLACSARLRIPLVCDARFQNFLFTLSRTFLSAHCMLLGKKTCSRAKPAVGTPFSNSFRAPCTLKTSLSVFAGSSQSGTPSFFSIDLRHEGVLLESHLSSFVHFSKGATLASAAVRLTSASASSLKSKYFPIIDSFQLNLVICNPAVARYLAAPAALTFWIMPKAPLQPDTTNGFSKL